MTIGGISLVVNIRNQFAKAVRRDGIDGLIKTLQDKNGGQLQTSGAAMQK